MTKTPPPPPPDDDTPLGEVRDWLRGLAKGMGADCPCCGQFCKVYKRTLGTATATTMIALWRRGEGRDYVNVPELFNSMGGIHGGTGDGTKGHHWGLMEQMPGDREDGSKRNGWWRLTDLGREFVQSHIKMPRYADVYNGRTLKLHGPDWTIRDALGHKFDYDELMGHKP